MRERSARSRTPWPDRHFRPFARTSLIILLIGVKEDRQAEKHNTLTALGAPEGNDSRKSASALNPMVATHRPHGIMEVARRAMPLLWVAPSKVFLKPGYSPGFGFSGAFRRSSATRIASLATRAANSTMAEMSLMIRNTVPNTIGIALLPAAKLARPIGRRIPRHRRPAYSNASSEVLPSSERDQNKSGSESNQNLNRIRTESKPRW